MVNNFIRVVGAVFVIGSSGLENTARGTTTPNVTRGTHVPGQFDFSHGEFRLTLGWKNGIQPNPGSSLVRININNNTGSNNNTVLNSGQLLILSLADARNPNFSRPVSLTSCIIEYDENSDEGRITITFDPGAYFLTYNSAAGFPHPRDAHTHNVSGGGTIPNALESLKTAFLALHFFVGAEVDITYIKLQRIPFASYEITIEQTTGGEISVVDAIAEERSTVTVTANPDSGFRLDSIVVTNKATGNPIPGLTVTVTGDTANFVMPGTDIIIRPVFAKILYGVEITIGHDLDFGVGESAISLTADQNLTVNITTHDTPYLINSAHYSVNGKASKPASLTSNSFTINGSEFNSGVNYLTIFVVLNNGHAYSRLVTVTVAE